MAQLMHQIGFTVRHKSRKIRSNSKPAIAQSRAAAIGITLLAAAASPIGHAQLNPAQHAMELERAGQLPQAESAWRALALKYPSNPEPLAHLGLLEAKQEHYKEAIEDYRKAMAIAPAMPGLRLNLGLAYFKQGDYRNAVAMFEPLYKANPADQRLNILLGMSHFGLDQFVAATPFLKRAAESDPENSTLLLTLAHSCLLSNDYPCVMDTYHRLISINAESAEVDMLVGEALDEMKDRDGAIREFKAAVVADPKAPNVHFGLGYLYWKNQQFKDAADQFEQELANDPGHPLAALYLANSEIQLGQSEKALPLLERLVKTEPKNAMAHLDLGMAYADRHRNEEAVREFKAASELDPRDVNPHWRLGRLYRTMGKTAEAKAEFEKANSLNKAADDRLLKIMSTIPSKKPGTPDSGTPSKP